jgi:hypothetical protein
MEKLLRLNPLDAVNPVLSEGRILYPPQRIALPQYAPMNLLRKVLSTRKTIFNFIAGTSCLVVAISIFISVLRYQHFHPDEGEMHSFYQFYAMILIFASAMFYIQLSGGDSLSKKEFPDPNPQTARLRSHIFRQIPTRIFASFRNIVWFIIGTACVVIGLYSIYVVINYDIGHSNNSNPYLGFAKLSGFIFLAAMFCYIQVFYVPRKKN